MSEKVWQLKVSGTHHISAHYFGVRSEFNLTDDEVKAQGYAKLASQGYDISGITLIITRRP